MCQQQKKDMHSKLSVQGNNSILPLISIYKYLMKCKCKWSMSQVLLNKISYPCFATQTFFPINKSNCLKFESECLF